MGSGSRASPEVPSIDLNPVRYDHCSQEFLYCDPSLFGHSFQFHVDLFLKGLHELSIHSVSRLELSPSCSYLSCLHVVRRVMDCDNRPSEIEKLTELKQESERNTRSVLVVRDEGPGKNSHREIPW